MEQLNVHLREQVDAAKLTGLLYVNEEQFRELGDIAPNYCTLSTCRVQEDVEKFYMQADSSRLSVMDQLQLWITPLVRDLIHALRARLESQRGVLAALPPCLHLNREAYLVSAFAHMQIRHLPSCWRPELEWRQEQQQAIRSLEIPEDKQLAFQQGFQTALAYLCRTSNSPCFCGDHVGHTTLTNGGTFLVAAKSQEIA